jgi:hypothetical protein
MAVTHHAYNIVKIPGCSGTITICGQVQDAMRSVEHAYKDAAAAFPADEDALEPLERPAKKKQLSSQVIAAIERVPPDVSTITRGVKRMMVNGGSTSQSREVGGSVAAYFEEVHHLEKRFKGMELRNGQTAPGLPSGGHLLAFLENRPTDWTAEMVK